METAAGPWQTGPLPDEDGALILVEMNDPSPYWGKMDNFRLLVFKSGPSEWWTMNNSWTTAELQKAISRWARINE